MTKQKQNELRSKIEKLAKTTIIKDAVGDSADFYIKDLEALYKQEMASKIKEIKKLKAHDVVTIFKGGRL